VQDPFPTIDWSYDLEEDGAEYFGPFSSRFVVESAIETMNRLFLLRECEGHIHPDSKESTCLYYDIKRCGGPCALHMSRDEYLTEVARVKRFLQGEHAELLADLTGKMEAHAEALRFEEAAAVKMRLDELRRVIRQQEKMHLPVLDQDMILLTPARRTSVEVHCLRGGKLARKAVANQQEIDRKGIEKMIREIYGARQRELFETEREVVSEMRIIAMWCLAHRDETIIVNVLQGGNIKSVAREVCEAIARCGISDGSPEMESALVDK
jgi:excinuclease UvrABC nuclease subunit